MICDALNNPTNVEYLRSSKLPSLYFVKSRLFDLNKDISFHSLSPILSVIPLYAAESAEESSLPDTSFVVIIVSFADVISLISKSYIARTIEINSWLLL